MRKAPRKKPATAGAKNVSPPMAQMPATAKAGKEGSTALRELAALGRQVETRHGRGFVIVADDGAVIVSAALNASARVEGGSP